MGPTIHNNSHNINKNSSIDISQKKLLSKPNFKLTILKFLSKIAKSTPKTTEAQKDNNNKNNSNINSLDMYTDGSNYKPRLKPLDRDQRKKLESHLPKLNTKPESNLQANPTKITTGPLTRTKRLQKKSFEEMIKFDTKEKIVKVLTPLIGPTQQTCNTLMQQKIADKLTKWKGVQLTQMEAYNETIHIQTSFLKEAESKTSEISKSNNKTLDKLTNDINKIDRDAAQTKIKVIQEVIKAETLKNTITLNFINDLESKIGTPDLETIFKNPKNYIENLINDKSLSNDQKIGLRNILSKSLKDFEIINNEINKEMTILETKDTTFIKNALKNAEAKKSNKAGLMFKIIGIKIHNGFRQLAKNPAQTIAYGFKKLGETIVDALFVKFIPIIPIINYIKEPSVANGLKIIPMLGETISNTVTNVKKALTKGSITGFNTAMNKMYTALNKASEPEKIKKLKTLVFNYQQKTFEDIDGVKEATKTIKTEIETLENETLKNELTKILDHKGGQNRLFTKLPGIALKIISDLSQSVTSIAAMASIAIPIAGAVAGVSALVTLATQATMLLKNSGQSIYYAVENKKNESDLNTGLKDLEKKKNELKNILNNNKELSELKEKSKSLLKEPKLHEAENTISAYKIALKDATLSYIGDISKNIKDGTNNSRKRDNHIIKAIFDVLNLTIATTSAVTIGGEDIADQFKKPLEASTSLGLIATSYSADTAVEEANNIHNEAYKDKATDVGSKSNIIKSRWKTAFTLVSASKDHLNTLNKLSSLYQNELLNTVDTDENLSKKPTSTQLNALEQLQAQKLVECEDGKWRTTDLGKKYNEVIITNAQTVTI